MDIKEVRTHLGRVKTYYLRNETERAVAAIVMGIKGMGNKPFPSDLRSMVREAVQMLGKDESVVKILGKTVIYQPGKEQDILAAFAKVYKILKGEAETENHDTALNRKLNIDRTLNQGMKLLEQNKVSEADECFNKAIGFYKDEHFLFAIIGKALLEANQVRRALPYLKRAAKVNPKNDEVQAMLVKCSELRESMQK